MIPGLEDYNTCWRKGAKKKVRGEAPKGYHECGATLDVVRLQVRFLIAPQAPSINGPSINSIGKITMLDIAYSL